MSFPNLTLTSVVFELKNKTKDIATAIHLTLTSVVFEF